ncbi:SpoIID/LytB domain-containing protein [Cyanobium sp. CH-040]|uniref:SpoIID/LytB domain-containing protein n=1 Tax=Cyanobium sp. CH-040 TaxID=2823708 RepID=UPI0020CCD520|nr:SpoIID/LytB domain-containing protein [Cyanobium sp. CH-040]
MPMAVVALSVGYLAQSLAPRPHAVTQGDLLDTLLDMPAPASPPDTYSSAEQLRAFQAQRAEADAGEAPIRNGAAGVPTLVEPAAAAPVDLEIRVALLGAGSSPSLSARGPWQLLSRDGAVLQQGGPGEAVELGGIWAAGPEAWLQTSGQALLVNGQPYAGRLRLLQQDGRLRLVNHLGLETYISSVVGAEMPTSWSMEALRAQAVAARSYALAHMARPADPHWHLGDTTRWQAYRGLTSVNERTRHATASTAGLILSYQGAIVESLYAATYQITVEAHGHLGASMSQHGAQDLALRGYTYNQILGHYYQGASLARLKAGAAG